MNEKDHKKSHRGGRNPHTISMIFEEEEEDLDDDFLVNQMVVELVKGKLYSCPTLQHFKGQKVEGKHHSISTHLLTELGGKLEYQMKIVPLSNKGNNCSR